VLSLPLAFGTTLETIPSQVPYLRAPPERVTKWRGLLSHAERPRIGLVWSGKLSHKNDHNRSIALARLAPLLACPASILSACSANIASRIELPCRSSPIPSVSMRR
jgi:hypothetical protein